MKIFKYNANITDMQTFEMPAGAQILSAKNQHGELCLWVLVNENEPSMTQRHIEIIGTGNPIPQDMGIDRKFIDTVVINPFVWHVFERL